MTDYNSGFNSGLNQNYNFNTRINPQQNTANTGVNHINPYINALRQSAVQQNTNMADGVLNQQKQNSPQTQEAVKQEAIRYENIKMDSDVLLKYLQNIMKMPENINKLLTTLDNPIMKALTGKNIDEKILAEILKNNSTEAVEKVLKTISSSLKAGIKDVSQLKDVLNILSTIQNTTSNNAVKELLLLYIPVNPPIYDKNVDFKPGSDDEEEAINNSNFTLIFETVNFSNISCCINSYDNTLYLQIFADKFFPFEKFKKVVDVFKKEMNLRVELENRIIPREEKDKKSIKNFKILSSGFVSLDVLILAHLIVKTIFRIDEDFMLT